MRIPNPAKTWSIRPNAARSSFHIVDVNDRAALGVVLDMAPEHLATRHPLVAPFVVLDLRKTRRNLGQGRVHARRDLVLGFEHSVELFEHVRVGHGRERRTNPQMDAPNGRVGVLDDRRIVLTADPYLVGRGRPRSLQSQTVLRHRASVLRSYRGVRNFSMHYQHLPRRLRAEPIARSMFAGSLGIPNRPNA